MKLVIALLLVAGAAPAQVKRLSLADSSVPRILAFVGPNAEGGVVYTAMRQIGRSQPRAKLDELADSLLARALVATQPRRTDSVRYQFSLEALTALAEAGDMGNPSGQPYPGAFERLIQAHRRASVCQLRCDALMLLPGVNATGDAERYLREVAASSDTTASTAVRRLIVEAGGGTVGGAQPTAARRTVAAQILRDLYATHAVTNTLAKSVLRDWIWAQPAERR